MGLTIISLFWNGAAGFCRDCRDLVCTPRCRRLAQKKPRELVVLVRNVALVDDDESVRESLSEFLKLLGFEGQTFSSAEEFLSSDGLRRTECLILDVAMPGMSGPELQQELIRLKCDFPIVFITARPDDNLCAKVLGRGAVACLTKPLSETVILEAINIAFEKK